MGLKNLGFGVPIGTTQGWVCVLCLVIYKLLWLLPFISIFLIQKY
jgi:hypothetical protein